MKRKILAMVLAVAMIVSGVAPAGEVRAEEIQNEVKAGEGQEDFSYTELEDGTLKITRYSGTDTELVIPGEINGKKVTSIGSYTFSGF